MQLTAKIARVRIADDVFQTGDGILTPQITVDLGEDRRSSSCRFTVNDPGLVIGAKYREISVSQGGIQVPRELLGTSSNGTAQNLPPGNVPGVSSSNQSANTSLTPEVRAFLDVIAFAEGADYNVMFTGRRFSDFSRHPDQVICSGGLCSSAAGRYQFLTTTWNEVRRRLNLPDFSPASQDLAGVELIRRRGALDEVQRGLAGFDAAIALCNKEWASFPGSPYGQPVKTLPELRRVYEQALAKYKGGSSAPLTPPATPAPTPTVTQTPPSIESSKKGTEIIIELAVGRGVSFKDAISFHFIHTATETTWGANGAQQTTFTGQSVRWLLTRVPVTESFENITFKQFLEAKARSFGLKLEMEGNGLNYQHLSQDGQTHLELILREARRIGFSIREGTGRQSGTLIVEPSARPTFTNFLIDEEVLIKPAIFTDKARESKSGAPGATVSSPQTGAGELATVIDREFGAVKQKASQSKAGTGKAQTDISGSPGATAPPVGGTVKPDSAPATSPAPSTPSETKTEREEEPARTVTRTDGARVTTSRVTETRTRVGEIVRTITTRSSVVPTVGSPTAQTVVEVFTITEAGRAIKKTVSVVGSPDQVTNRTEKLTAEDKRLLELSKSLEIKAAPKSGDGLPNQQAGAIDLLDGRAEAQAISDEAKRMRGYEDSYVLTMNADTLQLVPSQIVGLSKKLFPDAFATEKRIASVSHDFAKGTTTLNTYTPQAPPPGGVTQFASPTNAAAVNPGGFIWMIPRGLTTIGDGFGTRSGRPPGYRHTILDATAPGGTPVVAMADGAITYTQLNAGGAGHLMEITYAGGYKSVYMHGYAPDPFIVKSGPVKQGQPVFRVGTTGLSSGDHLHLKFTLNGTYCLLSKVGIDVLKLGVPVRRYNETCNQY